MCYDSDVLFYFPLLIIYTMCFSNKTFLYISCYCLICIHNWVCMEMIFVFMFEVWAKNDLAYLVCVISHPTISPSHNIERNYNENCSVLSSSQDTMIRMQLNIIICLFYNLLTLLNVISQWINKKVQGKNQIAINVHYKDISNDLTYIKFKCSISNDYYEEIIPYNNNLN